MEMTYYQQILDGSLQTMEDGCRRAKRSFRWYFYSEPHLALNVLLFLQLVH